MAQIRITPEQMREKSQRFMQERQQFIEIVSRMRTMVQALPDEWEGAASIAFVDQFNGLEPSFSNTVELIETISQQLSQIATAVESLDSDIASKIRG